MGSWSWRRLVLPARDGLDVSSQPGGAVEDAPPFPEHVWRVALVLLHVVFAALVVLAALAVAISRPAAPGARGVGLAALVVLAAAYVVLGRRALRRDARGATVAYLGVLVVCIGVLAWASPDSLFLLFVAYPQVWFLVESTRSGSVWTFLVFVSSSVGLVVRLDQVGQPFFGAVSSQLIGLAFSLLLGIWTAQVLDFNRAQSVLIAELEQRKAELAVLNHGQGVLAERARFAREIHDTLAQGYTSIVLLAQTATAALDADPGTARERLSLIEEVARENLREARAVVGALSPVDDTTLRDALSTLADRFGRETGMTVSLRLDAEPADLTRAEEVVLLRAAQEALSNARRHSRATAVSLRLAREDTGEVSVRVSDDGVGFATPDRAGSGLTGLRRRVEEAGGTLEVSSEPGAGTRVVARLTSGPRG